MEVATFIMALISLLLAINVLVLIIMRNKAINRTFNIIYDLFKSVGEVISHQQVEKERGSPNDTYIIEHEFTGTPPPFISHIMKMMQEEIEKAGDNKSENNNILCKFYDHNTANCKLSKKKNKPINSHVIEQDNDMICLLHGKYKDNTDENLCDNAIGIEKEINNG